MAKIDIPVQVNIPVEEVIEYLKKGGTLVEVVRCRECKYYEAYTEFGVKKGYGFCVVQGMSPRVDDWFCADGEREDADRSD